jgi:HSP20 family protein
MRQGVYVQLNSMAQRNGSAEKRAEIPGVEAENIDVKVQGNVLTIKGERLREHEEEDENFHRIERSYGSFFRSLKLPSEVDAEKIDASYEKGVLRITLSKGKKEVGKKIEISVG